MFVVYSARFDPRNVRIDSPGVRFVEGRLLVVFACNRCIHRPSCLETGIAVVRLAVAQLESYCGVAWPENCKRGR